jgi:hypothetical protein
MPIFKNSVEFASRHDLPRQSYAQALSDRSEFEQNRKTAKEFEKQNALLHQTIE